MLPLWLKEPSATSPFLLTIRCGRYDPGSQKHMARSMTSRIDGGPSTVWREADLANAAWHRAITAASQAFNSDYYIGGSYMVEQPEIVARAFTDETWKRLWVLCETYDPGRVVFDDFDGLAPS
ncbi:hypothetical protein ACLBX9_29315 [Methylobacterium sp. A49B]